MILRPAKRIRGCIRVSGDKSISHRAAIIAALAEGSSRLSNYSTSEDCASTLACLKNLGVGIQQENNVVQISGTATTGLIAPDKPLNCGNSGSTMRLLAGVMAGQNFDSILTGDNSLRARPMARIVEPLKMMGAEVSSQNGHPPLHIKGSMNLKPLCYDMPVASAQVKSCIMLAALNANGRTNIIETSGLSRDHTERMFSWFGVPLEIKTSPGRTIIIDGPVRYKARDVAIPGDISSAAFLVAAAALLTGSDLSLEDVGLNPTRTQFLSFLESVGCQLRISEQREDCNEPIGKIRIQGTPLASQERSRLQGELIAPLIDELPLLAVVGTQLEGGLEIRDASELRFKETDRIAAMVTNLRAMGATVLEYDDGLAVAGPTSLHGARLRSFGDHRIAMAFSIAALLTDEDSELDDPGCVAVSFPEFFPLLSMVMES